MISACLIPAVLGGGRKRESGAKTGYRQKLVKYTPRSLTVSVSIAATSLNLHNRHECSGYHDLSAKASAKVSRALVAGEFSPGVRPLSSCRLADRGAKAHGASLQRVASEPLCCSRR